MLHILITIFLYISEPYQDWAGSEAQSGNMFMQFMSSNDLMPVVLGVSLLIWFALLVFLIRLDRKVSKLEKELEIQPNE